MFVVEAVLIESVVVINAAAVAVALIGVVVSFY